MPRTATFDEGDVVSVKSTGKVFQVTRVKVGHWSKRPMVRVLDNGVPKWYFESELEAARV